MSIDRVTSGATAIRGRPGLKLPLAVRFGMRELRGGLRGFYVFLACIALGTATIAAVNSLAYGLSDGIAAEGQSLLGGDVSFSFIHREANPDEERFLRDRGAVSVAATLRAMARMPDGNQTLVELKGVDGAYPLYGELRVSGDEPAQALLSAAGPRTPALVEATFLETTGLAVGDPFTLGRLEATVAGVVEREPDKLSGGIAFGPRVMISTDALSASGLVGTGSLVRWRYRLAGPDGPMADQALANLVADAKEAFPSAGWRIETRTEAAPGLRRSIDQFAQFLTLVGLTSLAVGGVGVANAVRAYLAGKRRAIAMFRSLGASRRTVTLLYFFQIIVLALIGVGIGLLLGAIAPPVAGVFLADLLPVSALFAIFPQALILAALYGVATAIAFAIWPLGSAYFVRPTALFRGDTDAPEKGSRWPFVVATAVAGGLLAALAIFAAYDRWLAFMYVLGAGAIFLLLRIVAVGIVAGARALPRSRRTVIRLAVANIHRRGALTPTVTLSLGLSLTLIVTLALIDANLRQTLTSRLPDAAPSFFFIDIQDREKPAFLQTLAKAAPDADVQSQPMLRGRIVAINGTSSDEWPETEASWVLRGDRGVTYAQDPPENGTVVAGAWWSSEVKRNEVSFAAELAEELGVGIGDTIRVNVLGREVEATISNLRTVEWESLSINFVMIFSPNVFAGAPHAHLATLTYADGEDTEAKELAVLGEVSGKFPTVTAVRVKDALETVNGVVSDLALAIRAAASVTLFASILVLAGTLAASHRSRIYDAVILKTLGARRRTLILAYGLEYALLGLCAAIFGLIAGSAAAYVVAVQLMELSFVFVPAVALGAVVIAVGVTVGLGLIGTWRALGEEPARVLRSI
ncbi:MAG: FtsX-like permease family protein [Pseudomonadota bacterium]